MLFKLFSWTTYLCLIINYIFFMPFGIQLLWKHLGNSLYLQQRSTIIMKSTISKIFSAVNKTIKSVASLDFAVKFTQNNPQLNYNTSNIFTCIPLRIWFIIMTSICLVVFYFIPCKHRKAFSILNDKNHHHSLYLALVNFHTSANDRWWLFNYTVYRIYKYSSMYRCVIYQCE